MKAPSGGKGRASQWLIVCTATLSVAVVTTGVLVAVQLVRAQAPGLATGARSGAVAGTHSASPFVEAVSHQQAERYRDALEVYEAVLASDPDNIEALYGRGTALLDLGRVDDAEKSLRAALAIDPRHVGAAYTLGTHYLEAGRHSEVIEVVGPASEHALGAADTACLMALAYEGMGDTAMAERYYRRALAYVPDASLALEGLARLGVGP
ncbi:MAG: tetratricopeptide repeat protein [Clostridiales bacterium]|nr:tetratricopeptide repeat protein [Clostridiales bacterium]